MKNCTCPRSNKYEGKKGDVCPDCGGAENHDGDGIKATAYYHLCEEGCGLEESKDPKDFDLANAKTQQEVRDFLDTGMYYDIQDSKDHAGDSDPTMPENVIEYANLCGFNVVTTNYPI